MAASAANAATMSSGEFSTYVLTPTSAKKNANGRMQSAPSIRGNHASSRPLNASSFGVLSFSSITSWKLSSTRLEYHTISASIAALTISHGDQNWLQSASSTTSDRISLPCGASMKNAMLIANASTPKKHRRTARATRMTMPSPKPTQARKRAFQLGGGGGGLGAGPGMEDEGCRSCRASFK